MIHLQTATDKILEHARQQFIGGAFSLNLTPAETEAMKKAYPKGFAFTRETIIRMEPK